MCCSGIVISMNTDNPEIVPSPDTFRRVLKHCASQDEVALWVRKMHDDNYWWPLHVADVRTRMLIAGLSTRISYRMLNTYRRVVDQLGDTPWSALAAMDRESFRRIVGPLGLVSARERFWKSLVRFVEETDCGPQHVLPSLSNDELIALIAQSVDGAGYKVAQCCVLYARGYHCGVMPVDSGMKDRLLPCIGFPAPSGAIGHDVLRKQLEALTSRIDTYELALETGFADLDLPQDRPLTWWTHLVLIYYKRLFCNTRSWPSCPLRGCGVGRMCEGDAGAIGGVRTVILEGVDGAGKSTLAKRLQAWGFRLERVSHNPGLSTDSLFRFHAGLLEGTPASRTCLDRSFMSEEVYGHALRGSSRFEKSEIRRLLSLARDRSALVVYLTADKATCIARRQACKEDAEVLTHHYDDLTQRYSDILDEAATFVPVLRLDTTNQGPDELLRRLGLPGQAG